MTMSFFQGRKAAAFDAYGRLLVFAPPIVAGFHGAPLALATGKPIRRQKLSQRKNWAKRRAYTG
jgi:hypothetical protein